METIDIDLAYLLFAYQDDSLENVYYLDTEFGDIRLVNRQLDDLRDLTDEIELSAGRFLYVPKETAEQRIEDLKNFAQALNNDELKRVLNVAFESPHVLQAFKKILANYPSICKELDDYLMQEKTNQIIRWLSSNNLMPSKLALERLKNKTS